MSWFGAAGLQVLLADPVDRISSEYMTLAVQCRNRGAETIEPKQLIVGGSLKVDECPTRPRG
eukprot:4269761-Pyramimonas_sp.AAC.1